MSKKVLIPWSGGMDSTTVLIMALQDKNVEVSTLYISLENNEIKATQELKVRDEIREYLMYNLGISFPDDITKFPSFHNNGTQTPQPFLWICNMVNYIREPYPDEIWMGYLDGDCFWKFEGYFVQAFEAMFKMTHLCDEAPRLVFPLKWDTKQSLQYRIPSGHIWHKIQAMTWTCEVPYVNGNDVTECGECGPCKRRLLPRGEILSTQSIPCDILCKSVVEYIPEPDYDEDLLILQ